VHTCPGATSSCERTVASRVRTCRRLTPRYMNAKPPSGTGSKMSRQRISTWRIVAPSQRARRTLSVARPYGITPASSESAKSARAGPAEHTLKPADTASARTNSVALTLLPRAGRDAPLQLDADAVTRQLGFSALRESLDQVLERRLGL